MRDENPVGIDDNLINGAIYAIMYARDMTTREFTRYGNIMF